MLNIFCFICNKKRYLSSNKKIYIKNAPNFLISKIYTNNITK